MCKDERAKGVLPPHTPAVVVVFANHIPTLLLLSFTDGIL